MPAFAAKTALNSPHTKSFVWTAFAPPNRAAHAHPPAAPQNAQAVLAAGVMANSAIISASLRVQASPIRVAAVCATALPAPHLVTAFPQSKPQKTVPTPVRSIVHAATAFATGTKPQAAVRWIAIVATELAISAKHPFRARETALANRWAPNATATAIARQSPVTPRFACLAFAFRWLPHHAAAPVAPQNVRLAVVAGA